MKLTKQHYTIIFILAFLLIAATLAWYFFLRFPGCDPANPGFDKRGKRTDKCKAKEPASSEVSPTGTQWVKESWPLQKGMYGDKILYLQQALKISADGKFGNNTEAAVLAKIGKKEVSEPDYNNIINPPAVGGGQNYLDLKKNLGSSAKNFSGGVYVTFTGRNEVYAFDFYTNGRYVFRLAKDGSNVIKKGNYMQGGKLMNVDGDTSGWIVKGGVYQNMDHIAKTYGK